MAVPSVTTVKANVPSVAPVQAIVPSVTTAKAIVPSVTTAKANPPDMKLCLFPTGFMYVGIVEGFPLYPHDAIKLDIHSSMPKEVQSLIMEYAIGAYSIKLDIHSSMPKEVQSLIMEYAIAATVKEFRYVMTCVSHVPVFSCGGKSYVQLHDEVFYPLGGYYPRFYTVGFTESLCCYCDLSHWRHKKIPGPFPRPPRSLSPPPAPPASHASTQISETGWTITRNPSSH